VQEAWLSRPQQGAVEGGDHHHLDREHPQETDQPADRARRLRRDAVGAQDQQHDHRDHHQGHHGHQVEHRPADDQAPVLTDNPKSVERGIAGRKAARRRWIVEGR
jgi:hypothetical protein